MDTTVILTCLLIILGRVGDVSIGTLRIVFIIQGHRVLSLISGFFEVLIWVFVVSEVIQNLQQPAYAVSYALGFALGNYVGMTIEAWVALGEQVLRVFTREGPQIAAQLRSEGFRLTVFPGEGRDGPVEMLLIETSRKKMRDIMLFSREIDPKCFYIVDDVRQAISATQLPSQPRRWPIIFKRK